MEKKEQLEMAVMRVHKNANYTVMSNYHFKEKGMSLKAKGLLSLMLSLPDDWDYSINGLATLSKDGKDSVMSALKELEKFGYLIRTRITNELGQFKGYDYDIFEEPQETLPKTEKPYTENPNTDNPTQLNTNIINYEGINNLKNKEKLEKLEKRAEAPSDIPIGKPNSFTKELIKVGYLEEDDLFLTMYNQLFEDLVNENSFEEVRSCLWYFIKKLNNGKAIDKHGNEVENKFAYLRASLQDGIKKINYDPYSEESIEDTLKKLGVNI